MKSKYIDSKYDIDIIPLKNVELRLFYKGGTVGLYFFLKGNHENSVSNLIEWDKIDEYLERLLQLDPKDVEFTKEYDSEQDHTEYIVSGRLSFLWRLIFKLVFWFLKRKVNK